MTDTSYDGRRIKFILYIQFILFIMYGAIHLYVILKFGPRSAGAPDLRSSVSLLIALSLVLTSQSQEGVLQRLGSVRTGLLCVRFVKPMFAPTRDPDAVLWIVGCGDCNYVWLPWISSAHQLIDFN